MRTETEAPYAYPNAGGGVEASAWNGFSTTFGISEAHEYELFVHSEWFSDQGIKPRLGLSFSSLVSGPVVTSVFERQCNWRGAIQWVTGGRGVYLSFGPELFASVDPLGDLSVFEYEVDLRVTSVPDTGSTLALLGMGLGRTYWQSSAGWQWHEH